MINDVYTMISKLATPRLVVLLCVAFISLYILLNFILGVPQLKQLSGGIGVIDSTFNYSADKVYTMIEAYGPQGRKIHIALEVVDFIFPLIYSLFFSLSVTLILRHMFPLNTFTQTICLLPLLIIVFEYVENIGVLAMLVSYPRRLEVLAVITNVATLLKTLVTVYSLFAVLAGALSYFLKKYVIY